MFSFPRIGHVQSDIIHTPTVDRPITSHRSPLQQEFNLSNSRITVNTLTET